MKKINMRFLSSVLVLCAFGVCAADAAPTVKRLGTNTARIGSNATVVNAPAPSSTSGSAPATNRLGSIRSVGTSGGVSSSNRISNTSGTGTANRLGFKIGPYIQTGNVRLSPKETTTPSLTPQEQSDLETRIENLEQIKIGSGDEWILVEEGDDPKYEIALNPEIIERIIDLETRPQDVFEVDTAKGLSLEPIIGADGNPVLGEDGKARYILSLDLESANLQPGAETGTYTGTFGVAVDNDTRQVKLDIKDPVANAIYIFQNGAWTDLKKKEVWDPLN